MYVDDEAFARERDRVLFGEWFCVGRTTDLGLGEPGRVAVVDVVGESVLVMRNAAGDLHAAYNVCRHRGSQLIPAEPGAEVLTCAAGALRCPYHSWTYSLAGDLLRAERRRRAADRAEANGQAELAASLEQVIRKYTLRPTQSVKDQRTGLRVAGRPDLWNGALDEFLHAHLALREKPASMPPPGDVRGMP